MECCMAYSSCYVQSFITKSQCDFVNDPKLEKEYIEKAKNGDEHAQHILVLSNILWVAKLASRFGVCHVDFDDALSEGICGIYDAIKHFDLNKSVRFNTYSYWRIRAKIQRMNDLNNAVSRSANTNDGVRKYERAVVAVRMNDGSVDAEALLKELGWGQRKLNTTIKAMNSTNSNVVRESDIYSMNDIPGYSEPREHELKVGGVAKYIKELVHTLKDDRQRRIIELRFGLGCDPLTLQEVGDQIGVTKERIRQIETLALQKLKDIAPTVNGYQNVI